ncbi:MULTISPECIES: MetQ/NlpA family ABC transporter substrate-binding protein [Brevibacillus]|jgi:D-methionine transport system substrate-binding protein|uniref:Lipoprotein n=1 Tax=Brevibacillus parabrevis TaxID=54914 RepID=A0A4Y3PR03_BREPA|nr:MULTISPECIES: MetQ/NlpA family ABC transporter substrate-binding protein [Brevibacillus]MBU8715693.1 MetQ/NlpA family ABC transporter substrate-binding protein [Brevibacillus parabrevis]MDH6352631.1 D-methionine transport system substrate-binding protein [Brevibacillus sp. 1238]MDR5001728.1 MetQ/NlpA family ABC transporter substrate-binding protein [Brevibacillus parabrevis]MED1722369.1 MetQ/NlpA family ABC transporter substrate-binding protein [Brevibacillus parabrevis]MED2258008.1 MetQ/Nl
MKKLVVSVLSTVLAFSLAACGSKTETAPTPTEGGAQGGQQQEVTLKVGASPVPHAAILKFIAPKLKEQGVNLEVKEFTDYVQPNVQLNEKQLDANFFQHKPYLEEFNKGQNMDLQPVIAVHIEPFGAYSKKVKSVDELAEGATIALPNDPTNSGRALALLEKNGVIKLKEGAGISGTVKDVVENKKNLKFKEVEAAMLPRVLEEVDLALINTNYALEAKLVPTKDALFLEDKESPYANFLVARPDNKDSEAIQKLAKELNSPEVKKFIEDEYKGSIVPAF